MPLKVQRELDPLDLEIVERAFESAWGALKESGARVDNDSDEELEAALRRELIEIARSNGVTDPEILRDILLAGPVGSGRVQQSKLCPEDASLAVSPVKSCQRFTATST